MIVQGKTDKLGASLENRSIGKWSEILSKADAVQIWNELYRITRSHPLVIKAQNMGLISEKESRYLAQELFVLILSKNRFQYYLDKKMSDSEIEKELSQIELTNILKTKLKKTYPESYRLAQRITTIIKTSKTFKKFSQEKGTEIYGLAEWHDGKRACDYQEAKDRIKTISPCKGSTNSFNVENFESSIANNELEKLITKVLKVIDSPIDIYSLRSLVMSLLPIVDISTILIDENEEVENKILKAKKIDETNKPQDIADDETTSRKVKEFIETLNKTANGEIKQWLKILWYCYLSDIKMTKEEVAETLGISKLELLDCHYRIETFLRKLSFADSNEARKFEQKLKAEVSAMIKTFGNSV